MPFQGYKLLKWTGIIGKLFASNKAVSHRGIKRVIPPFGEETNLDVFKEAVG